MNPQATPLKRKSLLRLGSLATLFLLAGCAVGPDYQRPSMPLLEHYRGEPSAANSSSSEVSARWWGDFDDPVLVALVDRALEHNADVLQAAARVEQATAVNRQIDAAQWPGVNAAASAGRVRSSSTTDQSDGGSLITAYRGAASATFELDFWGRLRRSSESARAQALATQYAHEVVRQSVAGLVAHGYFALLTLDRQIALSHDTLRSRTEDVRLQQMRGRGGVSSQLDLEQAEGLRADAALQLQELARQRELTLYQLGLLTGDPGQRVAQRAATLPEMPPLPPPGMPSQLLERRPDVRQAEQLLAAANARIGVAEAARLPSFSLTGLAGSESSALSNLLSKPSRIWTLGMGVDLPIFDAGRRSAVVDQEQGERSEAQAAYQGVVHSAFKDVADALANLRAAQASQIDAAARERAALAALELARKRQAAGYSSYLELLDAQRTANTAQIQTQSIQQAQLSAAVDLYKALGGGWSSSRVD